MKMKMKEKNRWVYKGIVAAGCPYPSELLTMATTTTLKKESTKFSLNPGEHPWFINKNKLTFVLPLYYWTRHFQSEMWKLEG